MPRQTSLLATEQTYILLKAWTLITCLQWKWKKYLGTVNPMS